MITVEGIEGAGKTVQVAALAAALEALGLPPVRVREPGDTAIGERIRRILLDPAHDAMTPATELFLYLACRAQLLRETILPSLDAGRIVVCDRHTDATVAYQGYGRDLPRDLIERLNGFVSEGVRPDLTVLLDCPPEVGLARIGAGPDRTTGPDRFEREGLDFHRRVRNGYLAIATAEPHRVVVVDAARPREEVEADVRAAVMSLLVARGVLPA